MTKEEILAAIADCFYYEYAYTEDGSKQLHWEYNESVPLETVQPALAAEIHKVKAGVNS